MTSIIHLIRHGHIPDHRADHPLTEVGQQGALKLGREISEEIKPGEIINFFASPTRRTRQTAEYIRQGLLAGLSKRGIQAILQPVLVEDHLENMQIYLDGFRYDPVRPLIASARWLSQEEPGSNHYQESVKFQSQFWESDDPIGYWLFTPCNAVESPEIVAKRTFSYLGGRLHNGENNSRDLCVTHSANLRAFLQVAMGTDPGEPDYCGQAIIKPDSVRYLELIQPYAIKLS